MDPEARRKARIKASNALRSGETSHPKALEDAAKEVADAEAKTQEGDGDGQSSTDKTIEATSTTQVDPIAAAAKEAKEKVNKELQKLRDLTPLIETLGDIQKLLVAYADKVGPQY